MTEIPRVTELTRERLTRELDDIGPAAVATEGLARLEAENPEILDIATRCAGDLGSPDSVLEGFVGLYRMLTLQARDNNAGQPAFAALPRVSPESRDVVVREIDDKGVERFTTDVLAHMDQHNPELLQMAHALALRHPNYLSLMQGFSVMYDALVVESVTARGRLH